MNTWRITEMNFDYSQYVVDTYFRIAKTKDQNFADNINDYMFMYRKGDDLYFKNRNTRQYKTITFQLWILNLSNGWQQCQKIILYQVAKQVTTMEKDS